MKGRAIARPPTIGAVSLAHSSLIEQEGCSEGLELISGRSFALAIAIRNVPLRVWGKRGPYRLGILTIFLSQPTDAAHNERAPSFRPVTRCEWRLSSG